MATAKRLILHVPTRKPTTQATTETGPATPNNTQPPIAAATPGSLQREPEVGIRRATSEIQYAMNQKATQPIAMLPPPRPPMPLREFKFLCEFCGKKLAAPEIMAGRTAKCPECQNVVTVPPPTPAPQSPNQQKLDVRYRKDGSFKFHCIRCGQGLEAERSTAYTQAFCPTCHSRIAIPHPADDDTEAEGKETP